MPVPHYVDKAVSRYRNAHATPDDATLSRPTFVNPSAISATRASDLLQHLDLDAKIFRDALAVAYPAIRTSPDFFQEAIARLKFLAWMTLKGYKKIAPALRALNEDPNVIVELGFTQPPKYENVRHFLNERLPGATKRILEDAVLRESKRLCPTLGDHQVQDAMPQEARRNDKEARYSGYYHCRAYKIDAVFDVRHEAYLTSTFKQSTDPDKLIIDRLEDVGIHSKTRTVDGGYTSFQTIALAWRHGTRLQFRKQNTWRIDADAALEDVKKRYQSYWRHPGFLPDAPTNAKLRFLIDHGTDHDIEACGRYLRDHTICTQTYEEKSTITSERSQNEGLNSEFKNLPLLPEWRGELHARRRHTACTLTLLLLQLLRLQNGVTTGLCRTSYIV